MKCCICRNEDHETYLVPWKGDGYVPRLAHPRCVSALRKAARRAEKGGRKALARVQRHVRSLEARRGRKGV